MQVLNIESVNFLKFLSIIVAFYDTVSLHQACKIFILAFSECNHTEYKPLRSDIVEDSLDKTFRSC